MSDYVNTDDENGSVREERRVRVLRDVGRLLAVVAAAGDGLRLPLSGDPEAT